MANEETWGKPNPGIEEFFESIGDMIREFASNHNLKIEKYYQNIDGWELVFQHPKGGACYIDIIKQDEHHVQIFGDWWIDDFQTSSRYDKHTNRSEYSINKKVLLDNLEKLFHQVISWKKEDLIPLGKSYRPLKKEDIEADLKRYPIPNVDR